MLHRPWLGRYDDGVPASLAPYPERTLLDYVADTAREQPHHPSVIFRGQALTASRLERLSTAFAIALVRSGVRKGDVVALLLPGCPQLLVAELGAWKAGAIVAPLDVAAPQAELATLLKAAGAETLVTLDTMHARVHELRDHTPIRRVIVSRIAEYLPRLARLREALFADRRAGRIELAADEVWMRDLIEYHLEEFRPDVRIAPDDPATLLPSGGTGGAPRLVLGTHRAAVIAGAQIGAWLAGVSGDGQTTLLALPPHHACGLSIAQSMAFMRRQSIALVFEPGDVDDLLETMARVRPARLVGFPSLYAAILEHPRVRSGHMDFGSLALAVSTGAPLTTSLRLRFEELAGCRLLDLYGLAESEGLVAVSPVRGPARHGSVGLPLPDTEIRIVDAETGRRELPPGELGEVTVSCPQHMREYWRNAMATFATLRASDDGRMWIRTGDLGRMDEAGFLFLVDQKKDVIRIASQQFWPSEIEEVIASHADVAEAGVASVHDRAGNEAVGAWVVPRAGRTLTTDSVLAHCRARLAPPKVPAMITLCESLPRTRAGKLLRGDMANGVRAALASPVSDLRSHRSPRPSARSDQGGDSTLSLF